MRIVGTQETIQTSVIASYVPTKMSAADMRVTMMSEVRLIDANALRKAVNDFYDNHFKGLVPNELITYAEAVDNAIDSAPTVELNDKSLEIARKSIELGRSVGKLEGKLERPQGEWIDYSNEGYVECPFCQSATTCEDNKDELHYCFNCGAKLN